MNTCGNKMNKVNVYPSPRLNTFSFSPGDRNAVLLKLKLVSLTPALGS